MPQKITSRGIERNLGNKVGVRSRRAGFDNVSWFNQESPGGLKVGIRGILSRDERTGKYVVLLDRITDEYFLRDGDEVILRPKHPTCLTRTYEFFYH